MFEELVDGKKVLELGAGLGFAGIVASKLGTESVCFTDSDNNVLAMLHDNIQASTK